jgi:hypothetical protein
MRRKERQRRVGRKWNGKRWREDRKKEGMKR